MGFDIVHINLHKTFSQPHGGGGPGGGPIAVAKRLEPFLPVPAVVRDGDRFRLDYDRPQTIGKVRGFLGPFGVFVRSYAFIKAYGPQLREMSEVAVLNANYLLARLRDAYELPYDRLCMHEFVLSARKLKREHGVTALDVAKRLMDYGFHPPTVYFPLVVPEALMIEPTETEAKETLDEFADAMIAIAREAAEDPELAKSAPHGRAVGRLDEVKAVKRVVVRYLLRRAPGPVGRARGGRRGRGSQGRLMIDLRSDTKTQPTQEMRAAIAAAEVGDEQRREDPTVNRLEAMAAELLGQPEAVFVPTATMANEIALRVLGEPGDEVVAEQNSHIFISELGGPAVFAGLMTRQLPCVAGRFTPEQLRETVRPGDGTHTPATRIVSVENTHNASGGRVWPLDEVEAIVATARELELRLHLDGARVLNAATALGVPAAEIGQHFDTVTLCLSKGLGCPLGALVAGSPELMAKARRLKHQFGGAMRQAGIVAAAGVYALEHHVDRLAEDHLRARRLAEGLYDAGVPVDLEQVETNFVQVDVGPLGLGPLEALERLSQQGVGLSMTVHPTILRAVTHLDVDDQDIERAVELIPRALGALAPA